MSWTHYITKSQTAHYSRFKYVFYFWSCCPSSATSLASVKCTCHRLLPTCHFILGDESSSISSMGLLINGAESASISSFKKTNLGVFPLELEGSGFSFCHVCNWWATMVWRGKLLFSLPWVGPTPGNSGRIQDFNAAVNSVFIPCDLFYNVDTSEFVQAGWYCVEWNSSTHLFSRSGLFSWAVLWKNAIHD